MNKEQNMQGERLGNLWFSLSKICVVIVNTVVIMDQGDSVFWPKADLNFLGRTGVCVTASLLLPLLPHFCAYPPALIFRFSNVKMSFLFLTKPQMQKKCFILKFEPLMELQMTDGGKTTRLGDIQTGVENVMEKIRESKWEKNPSYLLFRICSFPDICFSMWQPCFQNEVHVPLLCQNNSMKR